MNLEEITNKMYLEFYHLGKSNNKADIDILLYCTLLMVKMVFYVV